MKSVSDSWLESARRFITTEECDCDCFLCIRGEHDEHCEEDVLTNPVEPATVG